MSIHLEGANRALAQSASTPPRRYAAYLLAEASPPCTLNGVTFGQDQVVVCPENKSLEGMTSEGMSIFCMDVSCGLMPDDGGQELRRFIAGYLELLPLKKAAMEINKRVVEYLLELSDGVTGRIIEVLRRAAFQAIADKSHKVGLPQLQYVGARMPSVIGRNWLNTP